MSDINIKLSDDMLDGVAGGAGRTGYSDAELKKAGVTVTNVNGQKQYAFRLSNGQTVNISKNNAMDVCDGYNIGGGTKLTDQQFRDLMAQS